MFLKLLIHFSTTASILILLGIIAEEMEAGIEDDFENFLHWVKSGNQHPQDFCFEDSFKPGV